MGTLKQFVKQYHIRMSHKLIDTNPFWDSRIQANHYEVILRCGGRTYTLPFSMGIGITHEPTAEEVLECLALDAVGIENTGSFEDWAENYGYSRKDDKHLGVYHVCQKNTANLKRLLGSDEIYHELLYDTEWL